MISLVPSLQIVNPKWPLNLSGQWNLDLKRNKREIKKYLETNENTKEVAKAVLRGKFIVMQGYPSKQKKSQANNLTLTPTSVSHSVMSDYVRPYGL